LKLWLPLALAFALAACSSTPPTRQVFNAHAMYSAALAGAVAYESLPRCEASPPPDAVCSKPSVVQDIRKADAVAKPLLDQAQQLVRSGLKNDAVDKAVQIAVSAVTAFYQIVQTEVIQ
jgi:uncharacterized lipoprotein YmbA